MQKTFLKFIVFELVERIARFRLLLNECADRLHESAPILRQELQAEADRLEEQLLSHKSMLNKLFSEAGAAAKQAPSGLDSVIESIYTRLKSVSRILAQIKTLDLEPEMFLFLKDILPAELTKDAGEQSVFLTPEGEGTSPTNSLFSGVLLDSLSILHKNNPLGWVGLTQSYSRHLLETASSLESLKLDLLKNEKKKHPAGGTEALIESLLCHALNLRLLGPAYYFHAVAEAVFAQDEAFLHFTEPALFFGLNHQNFTHKSLVIMHEACERSKPAPETEETGLLLPLSKETLTNVFRVVEKLIPAKYAFQEKHLERAIHLQERLSQGVLLSSMALYPVDEVSENLNNTRGEESFSIYGPLAMMTEYPHTPREIVNAGWLHKIERGPVWLYSILNEDREEGFEKVLELLNYQDHLLRKSIEVSEVHRVLLCSR
jgi:hypothetical protein